MPAGSRRSEKVDLYLNKVYIYLMLNIKNPEAHKLAAELARRTGVSMTEAVTEALREKLAALQAVESKEARLAAIMEIADRCASHLTPEALAFDIDAELYDELGLPK